MSYILDALQKAERERKMGAVPTLHTTLAAPMPEVRPTQWFYLILALILVACGVLIGWLQPWRKADAAVPASAPVVQRIEPAQPVEAAAPLPTASAAPPVAVNVPPAVPVDPAPTPSPIAQPVPAAAVTTRPAPPVAAPAPTASAPQPLGEPPLLDTLPAGLRQGIPAMTVLVHSYSSQRKDRVVMINNKPLHEGDYLTPEVRLEEITPEGMIFIYKGVRFRTGVR
ncbi:general secretion pathway protein GspB [Chitinimonas viridis]|uniref:General secretion pathway protein GspB n=1 Tax=Chitinimonas viridis TaxID=664880 RepID=A0ABT8BBE3_9NEIS|nr:general secretion pathway protein GspB [Chitinimonas viridis]MDN3578891.1 general secretion pathway protein GspB [Chitinimonas viridis]